MITADILKFATQFSITDDVMIERRSRTPWGKSWCVSVFGTVLDKNLNRHYEPMSSNRTDEFIEMTRFTLDEAFLLAVKYVKQDASADNVSNIQIDSHSKSPFPGLSCNCDSQYTIESHGEGYALFFGRCNHRHGYNLVYLTDPAFNFHPEHIQHLLNLGNKEYWRNPTGGEIAE